MKREDLEKYIGELSPEMQEKARQCKTMDELNALLAENDVELSEDALEAVAGGCGTTVTYYYVCNYCGQKVAGCTEADKQAIQDYINHFKSNSSNRNINVSPDLYFWYKCRTHGIVNYIFDCTQKST